MADYARGGTISPSRAPVCERGPEMILPQSKAKAMEAKLGMRQMMKDQVLTVRLSKEIGIRTRIAVWLTKAAGAVLTVPVEIEMGPKKPTPEMRMTGARYDKHGNVVHHL